MTPYLNSLATAAHNRLYRSGAGGLGAVASFLLAGFPQSFRRLSGYIGAAAFVSLAGMLYGFLVVLQSPAAIWRLLPASIAAAGCTHRPPVRMPSTRLSSPASL